MQEFLLKLLDKTRIGFVFGVLFGMVFKTPENVQLAINHLSYEKEWYLYVTIGGLISSIFVPEIRSFIQCFRQRKSKTIEEQIAVHKIKMVSVDQFIDTALNHCGLKYDESTGKIEYKDASVSPPPLQQLQAMAYHALDEILKFRNKLK